MTSTRPTSVTAEDVGRPQHLEGRDVLLTAVYVLMVLLLPLLGIRSDAILGMGPLWGNGASTAILLVGALGTLWRRRLPVVTLLVTGTAGLTEMLATGAVSGYVLLFEALWSPVAHGRRPLAHVTTAVGVLLAGGFLTAIASWPIPGARPRDLIAVALLLVTVAVATPLMWGWEVRRLRLARHTAESLAELQTQLATERAARSVETERRRIAQDLHDVLAGDLSAVTLHTSLATSQKDEAARERSLATANSSAQEALRDLRSVIVMLTDPDAEAAPGATLSWATLEARLDDGSGRSWTHIDERLDDADAVDPAVHAALLRIGAEAVTNAVRHGHTPRELSVVIDEDGVADGEDVVLTCTNVRTDDASPGDGLGLEAMENRARAVGGTTSAGPCDEDPTHWRITARLPRRAPVQTRGEDDE